VINFDDLWIVEMTAKTKRRQITYSVEEKADVSLKGFEVKGRASDMMAATFSLFGDEIAVEARGVGSYNLSNAAAAIATAHALGCGKEEIVEGLSQFVPMKNRMEPIQLDGITLLDDTYNANPDSMEAALRTLSEYPGRKIAVLGDMLELGDIARNIHRRMGSLAARMEVEKLIIYGEFKGEVHEGAVDEGMDEGSTYTVESKDDAVGVLKEIINDGDVVLVKGSRGMGMEEVVEKLREEFST
jgi:UDP-N-acetylmuramoyl-tripeptide--D-alanyl-D-alanine ligase